MAPLIAAMVVAGISAAGKGIGTAVQRRKATDAYEDTLGNEKAYQDREQAFQREQFESQKARDNEIADMQVQRAADQKHDTRLDSARGLQDMQDATRMSTLSNIQDTADQRKSRLFQRRESNTRRWGL